MKVAYCVAAVLAMTVGMSLTMVDSADAWCRWRCRGAAVVVAPTMIVPAPVVVSPAPVVVSVPTPNPIPLRAPCGGGCGGGGAVGYAYAPVVYGYYAATPACYAGSACYWRRNCWYDAFGRRFCN